MPDSLDKDIQLYKKISEVYDNDIRKDLSNKEKEIKNKFEKLLKKYAEEHQLKSNSSGGEVNYYQVKSRTKKSDSLFEKLIRKDIGYKLVNDSNISIKNDIEGNVLLVQHINRLDDIIGIRIVTELRDDCHKVYALLKNEQQNFENEKIEIDLTTKQPDRMKNGLTIYKFKCIYLKRIAFELQIKSRIDEAWGDMDHTLFYKDYKMTPLKNSAQKTMNNVGKILEKFETLLYDLRESDKNYTKVSQKLKKLENLNDELYQLLLKKLKTPYQLDKIAHLCLKIKKKYGNKPLNNISYRQLNFSSNEKKTIEYIEFRKGNLDLLLLEVLYFNWRKINKEVRILKSTYNKDIESFKKFIISCIISESKLNEKKSEINDEFVHILDALIAYKTNPSFIFQPYDFNYYFQIRSALKQESEDFNDNLSDLHLEILKALYIEFNQGNITDFLKDLKSNNEIIYESFPEIGSALKNSSELNINSELKNKVNHLIDSINSKIIEIDA